MSVSHLNSKLRFWVLDLGFRVLGALQGQPSRRCRSWTISQNAVAPEDSFLARATMRQFSDISDPFRGMLIMGFFCIKALDSQAACTDPLRQVSAWRSSLPLSMKLVFQYHSPKGPSTQTAGFSVPKTTQSMDFET